MTDGLTGGVLVLLLVGLAIAGRRILRPPLSSILIFIASVGVAAFAASTAVPLLRATVLAPIRLEFQPRPAAEGRPAEVLVRVFRGTQLLQEQALAVEGAGAAASGDGPLRLERLESSDAFVVLMGSTPVGQIPDGVLAEALANSGLGFMALGRSSDPRAPSLQEQLDGGTEDGAPGGTPESREPFEATAGLQGELDAQGEPEVQEEPALLDIPDPDPARAGAGSDPQIERPDTEAAPGAGSAGSRQSEREQATSRVPRAERPRRAARGRAARRAQQEALPEPQDDAGELEDPGPEEDGDEDGAEREDAPRGRGRRPALSAESELELRAQAGQIAVKGDPCRAAELLREGGEPRTRALASEYRARCSSAGRRGLD